ncbi:S8 family serine peptidase [Sedimentibacter sp. zth1]|uniref:S8 family serine peptidase n=1 Tax=Sedimentibacter sp. zth1 TaxID=2816908 RepID=UPI001A919C2D|nr:S8 family serine peptidase [Sedimentibacter sp. zth1]QSX05987.1 S8 family serine peptidase [Sedimentibacter sp. zth1]
MLSNLKVKKNFAVILTLLMIISMIPSFAYANDSNISSAKEELKQEALSKITPEVMNDFDEDLIEVLVYMKEQVDTEMIAEATKSAVSDVMTPYNTKLEVRKGVVEALKDEATTTQKNIIKYLDQEMDKGNVEEFTSYHIVNMIYVKATKEVIENISFMSEVEKIYKNKVHTLEVTEMSEEIKPTTEGIEWNIEKVNADQTWELGIDGSGVVVGSLDSGVDWTHPAIKNKWRGYDPSTGETNPEGSWFDPVYNSTLPEDSDEHGTHVMGTVLGQEEDGSNKIGVAPGARWIAARVFNTSGSTTGTILLSAAEWMLQPNGDPANAPDVVNNSWGGGSGIDEWYRDAVRNWRAAGIFPVFSAGNQRAGEPAPWPGSISCPANYPESFAVAATDINNMRASFSKLGPSPYDESLIKPEISAPGVSIRSSIPGGGYQGGWSGTSMSAPHITGTVALLLSANASLTVDDIDEVIKSTAMPLVDTSYPTAPNMSYGYGLVDTFEAVSQVASGTGYISGKVLVPGEDTSEPVINHEQMVTEIYIGSDTDIIAEISDDVAITEVELLVKQEGKSYWMLTPMNRISGDHKAGIYKGTISYDMLGGNSITYKIKARDYGGDAVVSPDYNIEVKFGIVPDEYTQGFEDGVEGWIFDGEWEYGVPSGTSPEAYEGEKLAGTKIDGNYANDADSLLVTPPIDLRNADLGSATLRLQEWFETEYYYDICYVYVSNDYGDTWTIVGTRTGIRMEWIDTVINLNDYIGSLDPVFVAFRFTSDSSNANPGWYIDNVRLIGVGTDAMKVSENQVSQEEASKPEIMKSDYVDPEELKYSLKKDKTNNYVTIEDEEVKSIPMVYGGIPATDAVVTVLETGRSVKVNPVNGKFYMRHVLGENLTLRAEAYGYYANEVTVNVNEDETTRVNIMLEPKPQGTIIGRVFDRYYNNGAANAVIRVVEDPKVAPVVADEDGYFRINKVYEGTYTLKVVADGFDPGEITVDVYEDEITNVDIPLKRFVGYEDDIIYDDGVGENALVLNSAGYGLAVRFTPEQYGKVKGANIFFWDNSWPSPGGNRIGFAIYGIDDNGAPYQVGDPIFVDVIRGEFNYIDLSSLGFSTDRDFYISTIQDAAGSSCPGTGIDENSPYGDRSYLNLGGEFKLISEENIQGGIMIRARMEYSVAVPVITNLNELTYTNQDSITVEGTVTVDGKVNVYLNGEKVTTVDTENKEFAVEINLPLDENTIMVTAEMDGIETEPSSAVTVIKDKIAPELIVEEPEDNLKINTEVVHVVGNVQDNIEITQLLINEVEVAIDEDGNFHERLMVNQGVNIITVKAIDIAGNETVVERTVTVELAEPEITNIQPSEDLELYVGDVLTVSFNAPTGGEGYFRLLLPFEVSDNKTGIPMTEEDGVYTGTWTVPEGLEGNNIQVEVVYISEFGYEVTAIADGRLTIILEETSIINIQPSEDTELREGDALEVSFNGPSRCSGYFRLLFSPEMSNNELEIPMIEVTPGFYRGLWTVPETMVVSNLQIEVLLVTEDNIRMLDIAEGRITVVGQMNMLPVNSVIVGEEAYDINYLNSNSEAQEKLIEWLDLGNQVYIKLDNDDIVDFDGQIVSYELLPQRITYYNSNGNITFYSK